MQMPPMASGKRHHVASRIRPTPLKKIAASTMVATVVTA